LGESAVQQSGTLYVTTRRLVWLSDDDLECGYAVNFLSLTMHAISRDQDAYPQPCIYTQVHFNVFVAVRCFRLCVHLSCLKAVMKASFHVVGFRGSVS
jgi:hypothetical protein